MDSFDQCWANLLTKLRPISRMYAWSAAGRAHSSFGIIAVKSSGVSVKTGKGLRFVPRKDFETIFPLWPDYKNGKVLRHELRDSCRNTVYVISILYWLELQ